MKKSLKKYIAERQKELENIICESQDSEFMQRAMNKLEKVKYRLFLINKYAELMCESDLAHINWENLEKNDDEVILFLLQKIKIVEEIKANRDWLGGDEKYIVDRKFVDKVVKKNTKILQYTEEEKKLIMAKILFAFSKGDDILAPFENVNEVGFRNNYIYVMIGAESYWFNFLKTDLVVLKNISTTKAMINESSPFRTINDDQFHRITAAGFGITNGWWYYNERKFKDITQNVDLSYIKELKTIDDVMIEFFENMLRTKKTFIISGANTGLGKTTLLKAFVKAMPANVPIGIIDEDDELNSQKLNPEKNIITLVTNKTYDFRDLFDKALKQSRKTMIVGEIVTPVQIDVLIDCWLRLSCGGGGTFHSATAKEVVNNLTNKAVKTETYKNDVIRASGDIARALDYVIHLDRVHDRIVVKEILKVVPVENDYLAHEDDSIMKLVMLALKKYLHPKKYKTIKLSEYIDNQWENQKLKEEIKMLRSLK